jgi:sigma-B regulation protein RsbU (phosphoserine phosphatase)
MAEQSGKLKLTDFVEVATLQDIRDGFAAVANVNATFTDADGQLLTQPNPTKEFLKRQLALQQEEDTLDGPTREGREYVAPITIGQQRLGTIRMSSNGTTGGLDEARLSQLAERFGLDAKQIRSLVGAINRSRNTRPAAIQFLFMLANAIARLCYQEYQLRAKVNELTAVYNVTMMLSEARDLTDILQRTVRVVAGMMNAKAVSIRLFDEDSDELVIRATHNLSPEYLEKGPIHLSRAVVDLAALGEKGYETVANMASDPRVLYPQEAAREGIVSLLSAGMRYKGRRVGVLRVYTGESKEFSRSEIDLLKAIGSQAAAAIENARLAEETAQAEALETQVRMGAEVQQRMLPNHPPVIPGIDIASVYLPCFDLAGDFFDFIPLPDDNVGIVIADVSGKGVPASLIMASVRAALRAQVDNVYYLYEIIRRLNLMLCRDTKPQEFVSLFYGVLDTRTRRLTYCDAGHPPPVLLRDGVARELESLNVVLGIDPAGEFSQSVLHLQTGDRLLLYTDGLTDAMNFDKQMFGKQRSIDAFVKPAANAESVASNILWDLRRFVGLAPRNDDVTLITLQVT